MKKWKERLCAVAMLLVGLFLVACTSKAAKAVEKVELGQKYLTELNYTEAVASFTEAIGLDPENIPAYMGRAEAYVALKQYDDAKADYTTAIEKTAEQPYTQAQAYAGRAEVNELTEELQDAESDYEAAQKLLEAEDIGEKAQVEDDVLTAFRKKVLYARAVLCTKLGLYEGAVDSYEKLLDMGEAVEQEYIRVMDAALWAISTTQDLNAAAAWGRDYKMLADDEVAQAIINTLPQRNPVIFEWGTRSDSSYIREGEPDEDNKDAIEWVTENQKSIQILLKHGFEIRYYRDDSTSRMLALYSGETDWPEENADLTETKAFLKAYQAQSTQAQQETNLWEKKVYLYEGSHTGKQRSGEGCWGILNAENDEWCKAFYQWENDAPVGGFLKKQSVAIKKRWDHGEERISTIYYSIGGTAVEIRETFKHDNESQPYGINVFYGQFPAPLLEVKREQNGAVFVLPAGSVVPNYEGHYDSMLNGTVAIESGKTYPIDFSRSVGSCILDYEGR